MFPPSSVGGMVERGSPAGVTQDLQIVMEKGRGLDA